MIKLIVNIQTPGHEIHMRVILDSAKVYIVGHIKSILHPYETIRFIHIITVNTYHISFNSIYILDYWILTPFE